MPLPRNGLSRTGKLAVVAVAAALIISFAFGAYLLAANVAPSVVRIPTTDVSYNYQGTGGDYLTLNATQGVCPGAVFAGSTFTCRVSLVSTASATHEIDGISVAAPFSEVWVSPVPPEYIGAGSSEVFAVNVTAPSAGGTYNLQLTVATT